MHHDLEINLPKQIEMYKKLFKYQLKPKKIQKKN
jgi:hypothetical protein